MLWLQLYGVGADGNEAEMAMDRPFSTLGDAIDEAMLLRGRRTKGSLARIAGFRVRNDLKNIVYDWKL